MPPVLIIHLEKTNKCVKFQKPNLEGVDVISWKQFWGEFGITDTQEFMETAVTIPVKQSIIFLSIVSNDLSLYQHIVLIVDRWPTVSMVFQWFTFLAVLKRLAALQLSCTGPDTVITFVLTYHFSTFLMPIFLIHWPSKSLTARRFTHQSKSSRVL